MMSCIYSINILNAYYILDTVLYETGSKIEKISSLSWNLCFNGVRQIITSLEINKVPMLCHSEKSQRKGVRNT